MKRVIAFICGILLLALPLFASANTERVLDPHGLITDSECSELEAELALAEERCGFAFRVVVYDVTVAGDFDEWDILNMLSVTEDDSLAIFLITKECDGYYYELFLYGEPDAVIDYDTSDEILDTPSAYSNIKTGKIKIGTSELVNATVGATESVRTSRLVGVIVTTAVLTLLTGGGAALCVYLSYKKKQKSPSYPLSKYASLTLTSADDEFLGSSVVKTRVSSSSSRSGGSRGGGGSRGRR